MDLMATRRSRQEGKTLLFLKKKKQKDFAHWVPGRRAAPSLNGQKFFGSFFQERTCFLSVLAGEARAGGRGTASRAPAPPGPP